MRKINLFAAAAAVALVTACAAKSSTPAPPTVLTGSAALATFPGARAPTSVRLVDDTGHAITAPIAADGTFSVSLPRGHAYKVTLVGAAEVPMVFPRASGALDTTFLVKSNGAKVTVGSVRYMAAAPTGGFKVSATATGSKHGDNEVDDDDKASCDDGSDSSDSKTPEADTPDNRADAAKEMAVGEHDAPNEVDGCDKENETESESGGGDSKK